MMYVQPMVSMGRLSEGLADPTRLKYEQLSARLTSEVQAGRLKPGDLLPSEPALAKNLNLARSTVRQALSQLERSGLVRRVRGKGTFVHEDAARRLKTGLDVFALIVPEQSGYYPSLMAGFEEAAAVVRNQVIVVSTRNDARRQADAILQLIDKEVSGVAMVPILAVPSTPAYQARHLQKNNVPVVLCHRGIEGVRAPVVALDGYKIGRAAGDAMIKRGHRRIAFISSLRTGLALEYEHGLRAALEVAGASLPESHAIYVGIDGHEQHAEFEGRMDAALHDLLALPAARRPTAIYASFDSVAELVYLQLTRRGLAVPEDISLISFGGAERLGSMQHRLTAVTVDEAAIGRTAANLLSDMRAGKRAIETDERLEVEVGFHDGQTLADA